MKNILFLSLVLGLISCGETSQSESSNSDESPTTVFFTSLVDGSTISSPFYLEMGVEGMLVEPKGAPREGYGHHHLLINDDFAPKGTVVVADDTHIHYGGGQVSDSVALDPGSYKLTLQFADGMHVSYGEKWSKTINIEVK